jgi:hypothetical protein
MIENRNGLIVDARLTEANGTAERTTALYMVEDPGSTVGGAYVSRYPRAVSPPCSNSLNILNADDARPASNRSSIAVGPGTGYSPSAYP